MTPEIINMVAQFMSRVNLQASEIDAYQTCMHELGKEMQRLQAPATETEEVDDGPTAINNP